MGASYAREKLANAVTTLAMGTGTIQERLLDAFYSMSALSKNDFTGERLAEWESIYERATSISSGPHDGAYPNTLLPMPTDEAARLASDIVELEAMMEFEG